MSIHTLIATAYLEDLPHATKLVLMAIADSSDEQTRDSAPGLPKLRAWSGLSKSRVLAILAELEAAGHIERDPLARGRAGRRAVYRVFPQGVPAIPHPDEVAARYAGNLSTSVENPVDNPIGVGTASSTQDPRQGTGNHDLGPVATGPLQSYPSVLGGSTSRGHVDKPAATPSPAGFPGARKNGTDEDTTAAARRARGANNLPCPQHPTEVAGGCGRCAHAAAESDPAKIEEAKRRARAALRPPTTATEENQPA